MFYIVLCRGRRKTRHKHSESHISTNGQARVNEGYSHDSSNNNPVTVAVISNGRQYPPPKRSPTGNENPVNRENLFANEAYHARSPADAGVAGLSSRKNEERRKSVNQRAKLTDETFVSPGEVVDDDKEANIESDVSEDGSEGSSRNSNETLSAGGEDREKQSRGEESEEEEEEGSGVVEEEHDEELHEDGMEDIEEEAKEDQNGSANGSHTEIEAERPESGYNSDYLGLNGIIDGTDKDRIRRTGSNDALVDHLSLR